jgi:hypothetical protein
MIGVIVIVEPAARIGRDLEVRDRPTRVPILLREEAVGLLVGPPPIMGARTSSDRRHRKAHDRDQPAVGHPR